MIFLKSTFHNRYLSGNTVPLRGLPESLVATSISRLTLVYCMLDIKDLSILVSMGTQLKSLSIVSDLSNVSKEAPEVSGNCLEMLESAIHDL